MERQPEAVCLDCDRRIHPRETRPVPPDTRANPAGLHAPKRSQTKVQLILGHYTRVNGLLPAAALECCGCSCQAKQGKDDGATEREGSRGAQVFRQSFSEYRYFRGTLARIPRRGTPDLFLGTQ